MMIISVWIIFAFCSSHLRLVHAQLVTVEDTDGALEDPSITPSNLQHPQCDNALGMESGDIADDNLAVSYAVPGWAYGKEHARLNGDSAWVTYAYPKQWIQIDLGSRMYVGGVKTQSKSIPQYGPRLWVKSYKVQYKLYSHQPTWNALMRGTSRKALVFDGNTDATAVKTNMFPFPVQAQVVRIIPVSWVKDSNKIALRLELLGCPIQGVSGCGSPRRMTNPSGFIRSMNYPSLYENNANCRWDLTASSGKVIDLEFLKLFSLESDSNGCKLDHIEVLDVVGVVEKSLGRFCGSTSPGRFTSTYNRMKVRFMSDHYERYKGFKAKYNFVNGSGCGGPQVLKRKIGKFQSMNYPENYDNQATCKWNIEANENEIIEIEFLDMGIHGNSGDCSEDNLQIMEVVSTSGQETSLAIRRYCGNQTPPKFLSSSNKLKIVFRSDASHSRKGFRASYQTAVASGCGGKRELTAPRGTLQTLNYPLPYPHNMYCEWNIQAESYKDIKIRFLNFDLEEHSDCEYDYVSIYDGRTRQHLLGKYCNKLNLQPLVAHSGSMKIVFVSDKYNAKSGFEASYVIIPRVFSTTRWPTSFNLSTEADSTSSPTTAVESQASSAAIVPPTPQGPSTTLQANEKTPTLPETTKDSDPRLDGNDSTVSQDLAKWIIIGLISVGGLLVIIATVGVVICCKHQLSSGSNNLDSRRSQNSGAMQNRAYDFSSSTNQSIRSRQLDAPESSQVSESISHQSTLRSDPNRDSHIYFSIDDYCNKKTQITPPPSGSADDSMNNIKIHFTKHLPSSSETVTTESVENAVGAQSDYDTEYEEEEDESISVAADNEVEKSHSEETKERSCSVSTKFPCNNIPPPNEERPKQMVKNILYESTKSNDESSTQE